jgi:GT2 family glycosyltransferase
MSAKTDLSIIIVNYNTHQLLKQCLTSIFESATHFDYEVIVVDNASSDGSPKMVINEFSQVVLIENRTNQGLSRANNAGAKMGHGKYLLFLNPDTVVLKGSLEEMVHFMQSHQDAGVLGPKLLYPDGTLQLSCRRFYTLGTILGRRTFLGKISPIRKKVNQHLMQEWDHSTVREVDWVLGACLMIPDDLFHRIGCFDEKYRMYFEDVDLCFRIKQQGYKTYYLPQSAVIHHHQRESARGFSSKTIWHIQSALRFYWKHGIRVGTTRRGK